MTQSAQMLQKYNDHDPYIYAVKKGDNMPSRLMPINQLSHNNSCT